jgi:hypothetical protein
MLSALAWRNGASARIEKRKLSIAARRRGGSYLARQAKSGRKYAPRKRYQLAPALAALAAS